MANQVATTGQQQRLADKLVLAVIPVHQQRSLELLVAQSPG